MYNNLDETFAIFNLSDHFTQQSIMRYLFASKFVKSKTCLDVGCGTGFGTKLLKSAGSKEVIGVDISRANLQFARKYYNDDGIIFIRADANKLPFPEHSFDIVVAFEIIEHLENPDNFIREIKTCLKPKGLLIISTPNKRYSFHPEYHRSELTPEEFYKLLEKYFNNVKKYGQYLDSLDRFREILRVKIGKILSCLPFSDQFKKYIKNKFISVKKESRPIDPADLNLSNYNLFPKHSVRYFQDSRGKILRIMMAVASP